MRALGSEYLRSCFSSHIQMTIFVILILRKIQFSQKVMQNKLRTQTTLSFFFLCRKWVFLYSNLMTIFLTYFDLTICDCNFHMKIMLKRWRNSKQNPLYLYSYFLARNKSSFLKSDDWFDKKVEIWLQFPCKNKANELYPKQIHFIYK